VYIHRLRGAGDLANKHNPEQAVDLYISLNYRQHNPDAPDGPQVILSYAGSCIKANPTMRLEFKRIIADRRLCGGP
jgi:predicted SnoaL-like aldol condensation-catalyzing enzyme